MISKQNQTGGDQSTNFQVDQMALYLGIDEKRAREVFREMFEHSRQEYADEAVEVANSRISSLENSLIPKMEKVDGALKAFADPSFQILLTQAQKTAAATERPADYDLLSELLVHRFQKGSDRTARAGISLAVDIIDKVADDALLGLTVLHAVSCFKPVSGDINQGLDTLESLFGKLLYGKLPFGDNWLDHLDILSTVRLNNAGNLKKVREYYSRALDGYVCTGIKRSSVEHDKALGILQANSLHTDNLVEHSLNSDFLRIPIVNRKQINDLVAPMQTYENGILVSEDIALPSHQVVALNAIYDLYTQDNVLKENNITSFMKEWDKRTSLKTIKEWWDDISVGVHITSVGRVLAHSNAQRCDSTLPSLN